MIEMNDTFTNMTEDNLYQFDELQRDWIDDTLEDKDVFLDDNLNPEDLNGLM
jgi:hypothetical protein